MPHPATTFVVAADPPEALTGSRYGTAMVELVEGAPTTVIITVTTKDVGEVWPLAIQDRAYQQLYVTAIV